MTKSFALHEKSRDLARILDISHAMIEKTDLSSLLSLIMEQATKTMHADRSTLYLVDRERNELVSFIAQQSEIKEIRLPLGTGIAGYVAKHDKTVNVEDAYKNPLFNKETDTQTGYRTVTILCAPMRNHDGKIIGVLQVLNKKSGLFTEYDEWLFNTYAGYAAIAIENARLHEEREKTFLSAIKTLAAAIDRRDPITAGHSERVARLAVELGSAIGLSISELRMLNYAAILHDVGKIGIRDTVLLKPGRFTPEERSEMNKHALFTKEILEEIYFSKEYKSIPTVAAMHHEKLSGAGYPFGLKAEQLNVFGRILAIADIFDALVSHDRPYRKAMALADALNILWDEVKENNIDPHLVSIFIDKKVYLRAFPDIERPDYHHEG
ncbi:MAG TPA: HD domain-containing phosphohydrolase [Candidatus Brocadiaceae bacterium]